MSTKTGNLRRAMLLGAVGLLVLAGAGRMVHADVASDRPGAVLIFPKVVVDTSGALSGGVRTDTVIQLTNTSNSVVAAHCYIVDMTQRCSNDLNRACTAAQQAEFLATNPAPDAVPPGGACAVGATCQAPCTPQVVDTDFPLLLTKRQPISWKASQGLLGLPCGVLGRGSCANNGTNGTSHVNASQTDPWVGEIKCVQVDPATGAPVPGLNPANNFGGDLKGEATIVRYAVGDGVDARKYNAIGLQATGNFPAQTDSSGNPVLSIGGPTAQYNGCPKVVILDHMFDDGVVITHNGPGGPLSSTVRTDLTVVPCAEDLANQVPKSSTLQFLVYNEFEQRFSTSTSFSCFKEVQLSDIDTRPGDTPTNNVYSIFNANVQGTLSGQTRIRPVATATSDRRILAISESFYTGAGPCPAGICSSAANTWIVPGSGLGDTLTIGSNWTNPAP